MMESEKDISIATKHLARRMNMHAFWRLVSLYTLWGVGLAVLLIAVSKFVAIPVPLIPAVAAILGIAFLAGTLRWSLTRVSMREAAIAADEQIGLKERLSSAVEILQSEKRSEMAELQLEDAADYARSLDPKAVCPRIFPTTAKALPLALAALAALLYIPSLSGRPAEIPPEVRQVVKQAGIEVKKTAEKADENLLSDEVVKLAEKMALSGSRMQDELLTKKEALKNLSNLVRETDAMKMMGEMAEKLAGEMTPEKERILKEIMEKLSDNLKDLQGMEDIASKIMEAQQSELSEETLKQLADALGKIKIGAAEMKALQQMSEQLAKSRKDIGQMNLALAKVSGSSDLPEQGSGIMGDGPPGKESPKNPEGSAAKATRRLTGEGYVSELDGQLSNEGASVPTEVEAEPEKGESVVPYREIYVQYRDAADDAIARTRIPWTYREHVKSYFDAIKPRE